jgi:hypothetical protein
MNGSLINHLMQTAKTPEIVAGVTGATLLGYSDRAAYTVIEVVDAKTLVVRGDKATRIDTNGMSDAQNYSFERDPNGEVVILRLTSKGWVSAYKNENGRWITKNGSRFTIGVRSQYFDYSF